jgi:hypothetical protein
MNNTKESLMGYLFLKNIASRVSDICSNNRFIQFKVYKETDRIIGTICRNISLEIKNEKS